MKAHKLKILIGLFIFGMLYSCEESPVYEEFTDSTEGVQLFIAKASRIHTLPTFSIENMEYLQKDTINFNVGYGGLRLPATPIVINLKNNTAAIDSINTVRVINGEPIYHPFPENAYDISETSLKIEAGNVYSNNAFLTYYPENFEQDKNYLLAIEIENISGYKINPEKGTLFIEVEEVIIPEPEPDFYDKEDWEVIDFSTQEDIGEGPNGFAYNVIDGDINSFWHSCWWSCTEEESTYPHHVTVDMKSEIAVDGFEFAQRQSGTRAIKDLEIQVSNDNVEWRSLGNFTLANMILPQLIEISDSETDPEIFRYFKIITTSAYDGTNFSALGEVSTYILE